MVWFTLSFWNQFFIAVNNIVMVVRKFPCTNSIFQTRKCTSQTREKSYLWLKIYGKWRRSNKVPSPLRYFHYISSFEKYCWAFKNTIIIIVLFHTFGYNWRFNGTKNWAVIKLTLIELSFILIFFLLQRVIISLGVMRVSF